MDNSLMRQTLWQLNSFALDRFELVLGTLLLSLSDVLFFSFGFRLLFIVVVAVCWLYVLCVYISLFFGAISMKAHITRLHNRHTDYMNVYICMCWTDIRNYVLLHGGAFILLSDDDGLNAFLFFEWCAHTHTHRTKVLFLNIFYRWKKILRKDYDRQKKKQEKKKKQTVKVKTHWQI